MILVPTNFFLFTIMDDYYRESGDKETVRDYLPNLKKILDLAESLCKDDGLIQPPDKMWNFFDWGYELNNITFSRKGGTMLNSLYITAMKLFSRLCRITDTPFDKNILDQRIARISKGLQRFISAENGLPVDPASKIEMPKRTFSDTELTSELSMAFALQSGVWDSDSEKRFIDAIISGKYLAPELYLQAVIFDELSKRGLADEALARIRRYWGQFIKIGRKTIPESGIHLIGRTGYWENASYCHGFTTHPAVFFRREILGIRDIDNGFAEFVFAPQSFDLEYASGSVVTPHGEIRVAWQRQDDKMDVELSLPCGVTAALVDGRKFSAGTHRFSLP